MGYYKLNADGTIQSANTQIDNTWLDLVDLQTKEDGSYYTFYNANGTPDLVKEELESLRILEDAKPKTVTMRQFRLALLQENLLTTVINAISVGTDEVLKIEWEYATEVNRNWASLIALATSLGKTSTDLDNLFQLASTK